MLDETKERKFVVYRGSVYNTGLRDPNALWIMSEREWDAYLFPPPKNATLVARGLTREVANKMIDLTKE